MCVCVCIHIKECKQIVSSKQRIWRITINFLFQVPPNQTKESGGRNYKWRWYEVSLSISQEKHYAHHYLKRNIGVPCYQWKTDGGKIKFKKWDAPEHSTYKSGTRCSEWYAFSTDNSSNTVRVRIKSSDHLVHMWAMVEMISNLHT